MIAALLSYLAYQVLIWCITMLAGPLATVRPLIGFLRVIARSRNVIGVLDSTSIGMVVRTCCMALLWTARILSLAGAVATLVVLCWYARAWWNSPEARPTAAARLLASTLEHPDDDIEGEMVMLQQEGVQGDVAHTVGAEALAMRTPRDARRRRRASAFVRHWVAAVRTEFPLRADRPSDRGAMSKWLSGKMRQRNMRYTHIESVVPKVVSLALNKSRAEVEADVLREDARLRSIGGRLLYNFKQMCLAAAGLGEPVESG